MIQLIWSMIRARRVQAVTILMMAAVAVGTAVASGVYVEAAQQRILADDVAGAPSSQRTVTVSEQARLQASPDDPVSSSQLASTRQRAFDQRVPSLVRLDGFSTVFSARYDVYASDQPWSRVANDAINGAVEYRQDFCDHVILLAGRCVSGPGEVLVSKARADAGLGLSKTVVTTPLERIVPPRDEPYYSPTGGPSWLVVVGVYEPRDATEDYWGVSGATLSGPTAPILTDRPTLVSTDHWQETQTVIGYALPGAFTLERTAAISADLDRVMTDVGNFRAASDIEILLGTIEADNRTVALVAGVATVPLIALCWYVLYLAIAYTAQARRSELGMVKLRGVSKVDQWWIAALESLAPVLTGAVVGYLLGHLAVWAYARVFFWDAVSVGLSWQPLPFAAVALAGAVIAGVVAIRGDLASSATELLRRVPVLRRGWRGLALALLACALAGVSVVQLRSEPLGGAAAADSALGRFAPALLIVAIGLLCAVLVDPVMGLVGARAMRRGRIGLALAGLHIGRRRSGSRLLSLVMIAVGLLTFAAAAAQFSANQQRQDAGVSLGADKVLTVSGKAPQALLDAVRSIDPAGDFAMAAVPIATGTAGRTLLAVDAPRLPKVAFWPEANGALTAQVAADALHPRRPDPIEIRGTGLAVFGEQNATAKFPVEVRVTVSSFETGETLRYVLQKPTSAGAPYTTNVACGQGCRLVDLQVAVPQNVVVETFPPPPGEDPWVLFQSLRQTNPDKELVSAAGLATWTDHSLGGLQLTSNDKGVLATVGAVPQRALPIIPPDTPPSLPMLDAGQTNLYSLALADNALITAAPVGTPARLPRVGSRAAFTDLEYLLRSGVPPVAGATSQVWLGANAPADVQQRLRDAGLTIRSVQTMPEQLDAAQKRPAAVGLRFLFVVALFGLLLGGAGLVVSAGVERRGRADELRALRVQGLAARSAAGSALIGYVALVAVATVLGFVSGITVWYVTGGYLPIVETDGPGLNVTLLPGVQAILAAALGGCVLIAVATVIALFLARSSNPLGGARSERTS